MNRGVWVGTLVLCLGGRLPGLAAQGNVWRPIARPADAGAALGRPVPITPRGVADEGPEPPPRAPAERTIAAGWPGPGQVIASAGPTQASYTEERDAGGGDGFASQRPLPRPLRLPDGKQLPATLPPPFPAPELLPAGNWAQPYPVTPPPPLPDSPPGLPFGQDLPPARAYLGAEYLLWWAKRDHAPILATTGNPAIIPDIGALSRPDTMVLIGGSLDRDPRSGGRFTAGYWLDDCTGKGIEVSGFFLGQRSANSSVSSANSPVITRPFFDLNDNKESAEVVAFPGVSTGSVRVTAPSELWGLEANLRCKWCCGCDYRVDLLAGARYLDLRESITITENIQVLPTAPVMPNSHAVMPGALISAFDRFATRNEFYGGQVGAEAQWSRGRWVLDARGKVALGVTHQEIDIDGGQRFVSPGGAVTTFTGGLLALPGANIGHFSRDRFSVVPEVGVSVGYRLTGNLKAFVGYNFLYWSNVVRPGDQIDRNLDVLRIPNFTVPPTTPMLAGPPHPTVPFKETDFWAQGLTFGIELTF
jgi:hypothetical protein